ncbi:hypothetical protein SAMN06298226_1631 [Nitrosovibrio sp. Nv4]|nr:hypothetical protein SAMN06298226_1631 [Nitrosovibrio sp. Nv4]
MPYHIECRRWFQKTYGNTYHSVRVHKDGAQILTVPFSYGYGDQCLETALSAMADAGLIPPRTRHGNGGYLESGTRWVREDLGALYTVVDVDRKKDL